MVVWWGIGVGGKDNIRAGLHEGEGRRKRLGRRHESRAATAQQPSDCQD